MYHRTIQFSIPNHSSMACSVTLRNTAPAITPKKPPGVLQIYCLCVRYLSDADHSFHVDHAASLPYVLAKTNFRGRVFMTHPTKAIYKWLIQDNVRVQYVLVFLVMTEDLSSLLGIPPPLPMPELNFIPKPTTSPPSRRSKPLTTTQPTPYPPFELPPIRLVTCWGQPCS